MEFKLNLIIATVPLLASTVLAGCYSGGEKWTQLGDDNTLQTAFFDVCGRVNGIYHIGATISECEGIFDKSFKLDIKVNSGPNNSPTVYLSKDDCMSLVTQAKSKCDYGGVWDLAAGPSYDSGETVDALVIVDPNDEQCSS